jgi:hypothetical protein
MDSTNAKDLAASMMRMYGKAAAFTLADRYAAECTANGDSHGHGSWATAAAVIGELIELERKFGRKRK